jgi:hypothetical protein
VAAYLIGQKGKQAFVRFLEDGLADDHWPRAAKEHYGYANLAQMQDKWLGWVRAGRPALVAKDVAPTRLVSDSRTAASPSEGLVVRGQEPSQHEAAAQVEDEEKHSNSKSPSSPVAARNRLPLPKTTHPIARSVRESHATGDVPAAGPASTVGLPRLDAAQHGSSGERTIFEWRAPAEQ